MFIFSPLDQFNSITLISFSFFGLDLSLNSMMIPFLLILFLLSFIIWINYKNFTLVPSAWQLFFESIYIFVFNVVDEQLGAKGYVYFPFIFSLFLFILCANLISMLPFGSALTSHIIMIFFFSWTIGLTTFIYGIYLFGFSYFNLFMPTCPFFLLPLLIIIEIFSYIIKFFSLAIRLSANIMAGHTLAYILAQFVLGLFFSNLVLFFLFGTLLFAILLLDIGVACLQAYVFTVLTCIYLVDMIALKEH